MSNVFFTSDLHLGHTTFLEFRSSVYKNDFVSTSDVDDYIIDNLNTVLTKRDHLWILGDVAFGKEALQKVKRIKGTKSLILGNHDRLQLNEYQKHFGRIHGLLRKYNMVFSHCPLHPQELEYRNWCFNVHGHIHHKDRCIDSHRYFNVNVDVNNARPIPLEELHQHNEQRKIRIIRRERL